MEIRSGGIREPSARVRERTARSTPVALSLPFPSYLSLPGQCRTHQGRTIIASTCKIPVMSDGKDVQPSVLSKWEEAKAEGRPGAEHILNIFKAGLAGAPFTGAIASLINDYIPNSRGRRLESFSEQVASDLYALRDRVEAEYLRTADFAFMFQQCLRGAAENHQKEKLEAFRGMLVNAATRRDLSEEEKEYFLNLAMSLSALHLRILRFMAFPTEYLESMAIPASSIVGSFRNFFPVAISGVSVEVIESAFADLYRYRLTNTDHTIFTTMTSGQGLQLLAGRISDLGRRFIEFCISPITRPER